MQVPVERGSPTAHTTPAPPIARPLTYRPAIDGLRALAVLPVILFHAGIPGFSGGFVGVDVFFVISGYLITSILAHELDTGRYSLLTFYERRARRILPALVLVLVCSALATAFWLAPRHLREFGRSAVSVAAFTSNVFFWHESGYFDTLNETKPLLHTWSLAIEEQYYLIFPPLLALLWRFMRRRVALVVAAVAVASFLMATFWGPGHAVANFYLLPTRAWELLLGALIALTPALRDRALGETPRAGDEWLAALGLALLLAATVAFDAHTPVPGIPALIPTVGTALILTCAHPHTRVARVLAWRPVVAVGLVSYSAYLWHQPLLAFARVYAPVALSLAARAGLGCLAVALAWVSWSFVEAPFRDRKRWTRTQVLTSAVISLAAVAAAGAWVAHARGFPERYPQLSSGWSDDRERCGFPTSGIDHITCAPELAVFKRAGSERRILFVGDSLLLAMSGGIRDASRRVGIPVNLAAHTGCPILWDATVRDDAGTGNPDCWEYNARWRDLVVRQGITDVVVISAFNRYFRNGKVMTHVASTTPLPDALVRTAAALRVRGVAVAFMRQLPDFHVVWKQDVNDVAFAQLRAGEPVHVTMPRATYEADSAAFFAAVTPTGAEVLDASAAFCGAETCSPIVNGRGMYADNDHPGREGDARLSDYWQRYLTARFAPRP